LTITLTLLGLMGGYFNHSKWVYGMVTFFTLIAAVFDLMNALPKELAGSAFVSSMVGFATEYLPFFAQGFGWLVPAMVGFAIGLVMYKIKGECSNHKVAVG